MELDWTNWYGLLAVVAVVLLGWVALKLAARVAFALIALALVVFALMEFGVIGSGETVVSSLSSFAAAL